MRRMKIHGHGRPFYYLIYLQAAEVVFPPELMSGKAMRLRHRGNLETLDTKRGDL